VFQPLASCRGELQPSRRLPQVRLTPGPLCPPLHGEEALSILAQARWAAIAGGGYSFK